MPEPYACNLNNLKYPTLKDFSMYLLGELSSEKEVAPVWFWHEFQEHRKKELVSVRMSMNKARRRCYGTYNDKQKICSIHCPLKGPCKVDTEPASTVGLCRCHRPLDRDGYYCNACRKEMQRRGHKRWAERKTVGVCVRCREPSDGHTRCKSCRNKERDRKRKKRKENSE